MAFCRILNLNISKLVPAKNVLTLKEVQVSFPPVYLLTNLRYFRRSYAQILRVMKARREYAGTERVRKRNEWHNWNYKTELYAFSRRLHENITEDTLRRAFVHDSYIEKEEQKRKELDIPTQDIQLDLKSNTALAELGEEITSKYLMRYLRNSFQKLPDEGIGALHDYLMSDDVLAHVSFNIGTSELIFCADHPPGNSTLSTSFKAIIGSIATDNDTERAEHFVRDFLCPQLIGKDVFEIWDLENPLNVLNNILQKQGDEECEPRLIFESGRNTIEAVYQVGLYSNKKFLGRGPGETLDIATEMAAYDALRKFFGIQDSEKPLHFGEEIKMLNSKSFQQIALND